MLKKGHRTTKAPTMAQLLGWSWEEAMFKCSSIAHWNAVKGRTRPKTSNRHMHIKKKDRVANAALRKGKSSLLQVWTTILRESSGLANFTWCCRAPILAAKVMEDLYFRTSSLTHSKPKTVGGTMVTQHYGYDARCDILEISTWNFVNDAF